MTNKKVAQKMPWIPCLGPHITDADVSAITEAAREGWHKNMNKYLDLFVDEFKTYVGKKYCLPVSHGTAAIHVSLLGLGVGPGDEVIVPDFTWVASAAPIGFTGAKPVFVDMDPQTWCLCPESFAKHITKKTKAVIVVDLFGNMPDLHEINRIARKHGIAVIEDAAQGIGAEYKGRPAGSLGDVGAFSFNGTKLIVAGQGGAMVTDSQKIYDRARLFAHHGIVKKPGARYYWSTLLGYNYNWTNLQAALALSQFKRLPEFLKKRRKIFQWYQQKLSGLEGISFNQSAPGSQASYWMTTLVVDRKRWGLTKEKIQEAFKPYGIDARPFFYPISSMPPYRPYCKGLDMRKECPVTYSLSPYGVSLPSGDLLTEPDVDRVCDAFRKILEGAGQ